MCALTPRRNLLPLRLAVAFGAEPAHHALAALERVDAGPQTHNPRPTWPCEAAYSSDRSQCYLTNGHACGDSVVSMGDCTALRCAALHCSATMGARAWTTPPSVIGPAWRGEWGGWSGSFSLCRKASPVRV